MCRDIGDRIPLLREGVLLFLWLIVAVGVDGVFGEDLAGVAGRDDGVRAVHEQDDRGAVVGSADAEVSEFPGVADGDGAAVVDGVVADPPVLVAVAESGFGFRERLVGLGRGAAV